MDKIELRAAADRLMYENSHNTADYNMLIEYIDHSEAIKPDKDWISVKDRLPDGKERYLDRDALVEYAHCQYGIVTASDIMGFPTADVQPVKHGKWENDKCDIPRCSCCSYIPEFNRHIDDYYYSDFCPNCGARMLNVCTWVDDDTVPNEDMRPDNEVI